MTNYEYKSRQMQLIYNAFNLNNREEEAKAYELVKAIDDLEREFNFENTIKMASVRKLMEMRQSINLSTDFLDKEDLHRLNLIDRELMTRENEIH